MASALAELCNDTSSARSNGQRARQRVEDQFPLCRTLKIYSELYDLLGIANLICISANGKAKGVTLKLIPKNVRLQVRRGNPMCGIMALCLRNLLGRIEKYQM